MGQSTLSSLPEFCRLLLVAGGVFFLLLAVTPQRADAQTEQSPPSPSTRLFEPGTKESSGSLPYLSRLTATEDDPIFATYAAPLRRSEYTIDEGYQFKFSGEQRALRFATDHSGDWGVAFRRNGRGRYRLADFYREPVLTMSYSDLVAFHYRPYKDVRVESVFQVYSSRQALQHLTITNEGDEAVRLTVVPFLRRSKAFKAIQGDAGRQYATFR